MRRTTFGIDEFVVCIFHSSYASDTHAGWVGEVGFSLLTSVKYLHKINT